MDRIKHHGLRRVVIPMILVTILAAWFFLFMESQIKEFYMDIKKTEAQEKSVALKQQIDQAQVASEALRAQLDGRLNSALNLSALEYSITNLELFDEIIDIYEIDEINMYNQEGTVIYSNIDQNVGFQTFPGHPIYDFKQSDQQVEIESDIRKDLLSERQYQYGHIKTETQEIIQIGLSAERISALVEDSSLESIINSFNVYEDLEVVFAIDSSHEVVASTNNQLIGSQIESERIPTEASAVDRQIENGDVYELILPLETNQEEVVALGLQYSMRAAYPIIRQTLSIAAIALLVIYGIILYIIFHAYNKNNRLLRLAYTNPVTGLANRVYLNRVATIDLNRTSHKKAVILLEVQNFGKLSNLYGYVVADKVLEIIGSRLKMLRDQQVGVFHFSNNFVLYVEKYKDKNELIKQTKQALKIADNSIEIEGATINAISHAGIVEFEGRGHNLEQILSNAAIAANNVNAAEGNSYLFFSSEMEQEVLREEQIAIEIRDAITKDTGDIYLNYQPIVNLKTGRIQAIEALARMDSSELESISPGEFIEIAENSSLIITLSNYILEKACDFVSKLNKKGIYDVAIAINISGIYLLRDDFIETISTIIRRAGIDVKQIQFEITETVFLEHDQDINKKLQELRNLGIEIHLDDFGIGYSNLSRLSEMKVDTLKIDRSFIQRIGKEDSNKLISGDIISIAHRSGLPTVAEGVEEQVELDYLIENGCDYVQGYYFYKPLNEEKIIQILKEQKEKERRVTMV